MALQVMYWSTVHIFSFEHWLITHCVRVCFPAKGSTWYKIRNTRCLQAGNTEHTNTYGHMEGLLCGSRNSAGASHTDFSHSPQGEETRVWNRKWLAACIQMGVGRPKIWTQVFLPPKHCSQPLPSTASINNWEAGCMSRSAGQSWVSKCASFPQFFPFSTFL